MRVTAMKGRRPTARSSSSSSFEVEEESLIRKGPWKAEEDEVLLKHVHKYGPRDWSSLRSKGLLHRTGKSCRLRWVNKLRPNLKNGCKFSAEEERIVIDLQAQLGNKWAKIATYLPGRTDNDVKNFWSSRQKRLARLLLNSHHQNLKSKPNKAVESSAKPEPCRSSVEMVSPQTLLEPNNGGIPMEQQNLHFPEPPSDFGLLSPNAEDELIQSLDLDFMDELTRTENPNDGVNGVLGGHDHGLIMELPSEMAYLGPLAATGFNDELQVGGGEMKREGGSELDLDLDPDPDKFFDDLPSDIFDHMDPFPSPPAAW